MKNQQESLVVSVIITAFIATTLFLPGLVNAGNLEPSAPPGPTMKTLDVIPPSWSQKLDASERFELVLDDQAVLDKETGLVWARNANLYSYLYWLDALRYCRNSIIGIRMGWRLPTVEELTTLLDRMQEYPALPSGHPFENVMDNWYWTSTTWEGDSTHALTVKIFDGQVGHAGKTYNKMYIWPVRGGQ